MSLSTIVAAMHTAWAGVSGLKAIVWGEPDTSSVAALLYTVLLDSERELDDNDALVGVTYNLMHRVLVRMGNREEAEREIMALSDSVPAAIEADPSLGHVIRRGRVTISGGDAGFVTLGSVEYRCLDFTSRATEIIAAGT